MRCTLLLLLSASLVHADLPNPIASAKLGTKARYTYEIATSTRIDYGILRVTLTHRDATSYRVDESLEQGGAGVTSAPKTYPLSRNMLAHVKAIYAKQGYADFAVSSHQVTEDHRHVIDGTIHVCRRLTVVFTARYQGKKIKGDLVYDLDPKQAGPLGIVVFSADIVYQIAPERWALLQRLQMRLAPKAD